MYQFNKKYLLLSLLLTSFSIKTMEETDYLKDLCNSVVEKMEGMGYLKILNDSVCGTVMNKVLGTPSPEERLELIRSNAGTAGIRFCIRNSYGDTVLHLACKQGDADSVMKIYHPDQINSYFENSILSCNLSGLLPLHVAAIYGHAKVIDTLISMCIQLGKDPWQFISNRNRKTGYTALHYAAGEGHIEVAKTLINASGCHASELIDFACSERRYTALDLAVIRGYANIVELFLKTAGNDAFKFASSYDSQGLTTIQLAIYHGHSDVINTLIQIIGSNVLDSLNIEKDDRGRIYLRTKKGELLHLSQTNFATLKETCLQNQSKIYCAICYETKSGADCHIMDCCDVSQINSDHGCIFCKECLTDLITYHVKGERNWL